MKLAFGRGLSIIVFISLIVSIFASVGIVGHVRASGPTYVTHPIIRIVSNSNLSDMKESGDCTGSGTSSDPYVISGYDISHAGSVCIWVESITVHLVISNCYLHDSKYGIELLNSEHVTVTNNNCSGNDVGIFLDYSRNITITNNICIDPGHGIYMFRSCDNIILNNSCKASRACAIMLFDGSNRNVFSKNTCYSSGDNGIYDLWSDYNTITFNTFKNNKGHGVDLAGADYCTVYGNTFIGNNKSTSTFNPLHPQSSSTGHDCQWNSASYGNYWSDWTTPDGNADGIVDDAYPIAGGISVDHYPLATIVIPVITVPGVPTGLTANAGNGQVSLAWSAPGSSGGSTIDYYIVYQGGTDVAHPATNSMTITGLTNGQSYSFRVAAHNSNGTGTPCSPVPATPFTVPGTPNGLSATSQDGQVSLSWSAPSSNGATIDYYIIYQNGTDIAHTTSASKIVTGLVNGISYSFRVAAHNAAGSGLQTSVVTATPNPVLTVPNQPTGLSAVSGNAQVSLSWTAPTNNGGATIDYYIIYRNGTDVQHTAGTSVTITGLTNGLTFSFKVAAHNSVGTGNQSTGVTANPNAPLVIPSIPTGLSATSGNSQVTLSWTAPANNGGAAIDYYLIYVNGIVRPEHYTILSSTITGLTNGQQFTFTVAAHNSVGVGPQSTSATATPSTVPGTPTGLSVVSGDAYVSLSWIAPTNNGGAAIDYYLIYVNGIVMPDHYVGVPSTITGLTNGQQYAFTVAAHNSLGIGSQSTAATSTPSTVPGTPTGLSVVSGDAYVSLSWTAPTNNGGAAIDYYVVYVNGTVRSDHYPTTTANITGLTNGQQYAFAVVAHNSIGVGAQSSVMQGTPTKVTKAPGAPAGLTATIGNAQLSLSWIAPTDDGGSAIDYYVVYLDGVDKSHPTTTSTTITSLTNGQSYNITIAAHNSVGTGALTSAIIATPTSGLELPTMPTGLVVTPGIDKVTLSWIALSGNSSVDYYVIYQNGNDVEHTSATSTTITGLTGGVNYSFAVAAHNSEGVGTNSSAQTASPSAASSDNGSTDSSGRDNTIVYAGGLAFLVVGIVAILFVARRRGKCL